MNLAKPLKYVIALDFEATCEEDQKKIPDRVTEIIEFPAVLMDLESGDVKSVFHRYVRPVEKPVLSRYCLTLTGIRQTQVNDADELHKVMRDFNIWLTDNICRYNLIFSKANANCGFITWTNFDINFFLASECKRKSIAVPEYFNHWINIKGVFRGRYSIQDSKNCTFEKALKLMGMQFDGQQHSGLDDARNLAMLTYKMLKKGIYLKWNGKLEEGTSKMI